MCALVLVSTKLHAGALLGIKSQTNSVLLHVDKSTGSASSIGPTGIFVAGGLAPGPDGSRIYAIANNEFYSVNVNSGASTLLATFDRSIQGQGLAFNSSKHIFYTSDPINSRIYSINPANNLLSLIGETEAFLGLAYSTSDDTLYGITENSFFSVNTDTAESTLIGSLGFRTSNGASGLAYDPEDGVFYMASRSQPDLYTINRTTGDATSVGNLMENSVHGLVVIPEPFIISQILLSLGLLAAIHYRFKYRANKALQPTPIRFAPGVARSRHRLLRDCSGKLKRV